MNMFLVASLICFLAAGSVVTASAADRKYNNQSEVVDDMLDQLFSCMQELEIKPDVCGDLLIKDKNHDDGMYDNCKCLGPCIAKRMGTMNVDTGKWNWARFKELSALVDNEALKEEAKIMETSCYDETNTHCVAGYKILKCALEHSPMTRDIVSNYLATRENAQKNASADNV